MTNDIVISKVLPQIIDYEEVVLGMIMLESKTLSEVQDFLQPVHFYRDANKLIYEGILSLNSKNEPIDILTVTNEVRKLGTLDLVGGPYYITSLPSRVGSTANIEYYARIIHQLWIKRELILQGSVLINNAFNDDIDVFDVLDGVAKLVDNLNKDISSSSLIHISSITESAIQEAKNREQTYLGNGTPGIDTGLTELNLLTTGWQNNNLIILAARPSMGKTAMMLKFAKAAAYTGKRVAMFSLEMSKISLTNRLILSETSVYADNFRLGKLSERDWSEIHEAKAKLDQLPIYVDDKPMVKVGYIRSKCKAMKEAGILDMVMIDYLQLTDMTSDEKGRNREQEVSQTSRALKMLAKELDVPVLCLSQLNRSVETRGGGKRPMLSDLRESGSIEQDADMVIFIYRPEYYGIEEYEGNPTVGLGVLDIAKQRDGAVGEVLFSHNRPMTIIGDHGIVATPDPLKQTRKDQKGLFDGPDEPPF